MEWINCRIALPTARKEVLVWGKYPDGSQGFNKGFVSKSSYDEWEWDVAYNPFFTVTHWMEPTNPNYELRRRKNGKT